MYWCVPKSPAHATCLILNRLWRSSWGWLVILLGSRATILVSLTLWLISPKSWHIKAYTAYSNAKMLQIMLRQFSVGGHCCILLSSLPFHSSLLQLLVLYISRKLSANEMKYSSVDKECLAIKWVAFILWYYLLEHLFTLCSGHILLRWLHGIPTHKLPTVACLKMTDFLSQWPAQTGKLHLGRRQLRVHIRGNKLWGHKNCAWRWDMGKVYSFEEHSAVLHQEKERLFTWSKWINRGTRALLREMSLVPNQRPKTKVTLMEVQLGKSARRITTSAELHQSSLHL